MLYYLPMATNYNRQIKGANMKNAVRFLLFCLPGFLIFGSILYECEDWDLEIDPEKFEYELALEQDDLGAASVCAGAIAKIYKKRDDENYKTWHQIERHYRFKARERDLKKYYIREREAGRSGVYEAEKLAEMYLENNDYDNYMTWIKRARSERKWRLVK